MAKTVVSRNPSLGHPEFGTGGSSASVQSESNEEAVVVDVVTNDDHKEYAKDGYNVGAVKFRFITSNIYRPESILNWAFPAESNISEYPLRHEIVVVYRHLNRWYYSRKLNTTNLVTANPIFDLITELGPVSTSKDKSQTYRNPSTANNKSNSPDRDLGKTFKENKKVSRLRHNEGDLIIEGRSGHSLRFGTNPLNLSPNIKIRTGQDETAKKSVNTSNGLVNEDINKDKSSIYLLADERTIIKLATEGDPVHYKSIQDAPKQLEGSQIIINSDRIVFNSKKERLFFHSVGGTHLMTIKDTTLDSGRNTLVTSKEELNSTAGTHHKFVSPKVFLNGKTYLGMGEVDEKEPVVLGTTLADTLNKLFQALTVAPQVITPTGPGTFQPKIIQALTAALQQVSGGAHANVNSKKVFTSK